MHGYSISKGEVWLCDLPPEIGREQMGRRPAVVVADVQPAAMAVIIPFTTNLARESFPFVRKILPNKQNGLSLPSVLLVFQLKAVDKRRLVHKIGSLEEKELQAVNALLKDLLKL